MAPVRRPDSELDRWFVSEILPHEAALTRYLKRVWRRAADIEDLRQEIYTRIYDAASQERPRQAKLFLFATARHLLVDRIRNSRVISIDYTQDLDALNVLIDELSPEQYLNARQEMGRLAFALDQLSDRMREAVWLRRIEGLTQREAGERLGISEDTLAGYLSRGLQSLAEYVFNDRDIKVPPVRAGSKAESE